MDSKLTRRAKIRQIILVAAGHLLLTAAATYPLAGSILTAVPGGGDSAQNLWNLWWVRRSVMQGEWFPFRTEMIYAPEGVSLAYHPLGLLNGWIGTVLQAVPGMNLPAAYNALVFLSFILSGTAAFYLVRRFVRRPGIAFAASLIFTYAPVRVSRLRFGNLEMLSTEFIPLTALFIIQLIRTRKLRYALLAGLAGAATAWLSLYLAFGTGLLVVVLAGFCIFSERQNTGSHLKNLGAFVLTTSLLSLPVVLPMVQDYSSFQEQSNQTEAAVNNSADLLGFFIPDQLTSPLVLRVFPAAQNFTERTYSAFAGNPFEKTVFIGYSVLALVSAAAGLARSRKFWMWIFASGFFLVLCLGPQLHIGGDTVFGSMPYSWLSSIPLLSFGRSPSRLAIFLMLGLSVVSAIGLEALQDRFPRTRWTAVLFGGIIFLEFLTVPIPMDRRWGDMSAYFRTLRTKNAGQEVVLDVPIDLIGAQGPASAYMLYQTTHEKPIVSGYISRTPADVLSLFERPFIKELRARIYGDTAPYLFDAHILSDGLQDLRELNVRYVIVHRDALAGTDLDAVIEAFESLLSEPVYADDRILVWEFLE